MGVCHMTVSILDGQVRLSSVIGQVRSLRESILLSRTLDEKFSAEDDSRFKNDRR